MKKLQLLIYLFLIQGSVINAQSWSITGNSGINPATNFLGTNDAKPLIFKVNKIQAGYVGYDSSFRKTAFGYQSLINSTGRSNSAFGYRALFSDSTGSNNTAIGEQALYSNKTGTINTAIGSETLFYNISGSGNTATGYSSLFLNIAGSYNTASGYYSLGWNATGNSNTAMGDHSLAVNRTGSYNTAQGAYSLFYNTAGLNTAIGYKSMYWNTSGYSNTAAGSYSLNLNKTGSYNTGFGQYSLFNTTGSWNTAFGANSLQTNATGFANTALGDGADVSAGGLSNAMALGYKAVVNASNKVAIGNSSVSVIGGQVGWSTFSDGRFKTNIHENVPGLAFINKLKPVTYNLELKKFDQFLGKTQSEISSMQVEYFAGEKKVRTGFIAQDVEKSAQELHFDFDGVNHPQDSKDNYSLVYADFVPSLVKAVQELSAQNEAQSAEILQMKDEITRLKGTKIINAVNEDAAVASDKALLGQNQPNPFGSQTIIPVKLPQYFSNALVVVTETATGRMLKTITVAPGATQLTFSANSFAAGSFTYSLYVDGKRIDTKQMVHAVTK